MKKLLLLAVLLTLPACVAPPIITVASLALSGVSYVETGKTLPDHALSSVSQRDCIMFRAAKGEQVCQIDETDVAAADGAAPGIEGAAVAAPSDGTRAVAPALPVDPVTVAALSPPPALGLDLAPPVAPLADRRASGFAGPTALDASAVAPIAIATLTPTVTPTVMPSVADAIFAAMPAAAAPPPVAVARPAAAEPAAEPTVHLVVGSFRDRARAVVHIATLAGDDLRIVETTVKNRVQYRVVAGPFATGDIGAARAAFAAQGVKGSWALRLESDAPIQVAAR